MSIAQAVKTRRTAKGWTQKELAGRTGGRVPQPHIAMIEGGKLENMKLGTLEALADAFGIAAVDLLPDEFHRPRQAPGSRIVVG
jgi:transcriptional regulator with XRE-family HTH domain